jgi:hypothetical protein
VAIEVVIGAEPLRRLTPGMRVIVIEPRHPLYERKGTVRATYPFRGAGIVAIDGGLADNASIILQGQPYPDRTVLLPYHCRELKAAR